MKKNKTSKRLKSNRSDNGGKFIRMKLKEWLENKGIKYEFNPSGTPQCNDVAKRGNRTLIEITRVVITDSELPMEY